ncbi:stage V sporulation protein AB [Paenibacillus baekrokdamisoli]|uniref:Stage V sporulation protein AB n=1 Tax=Paenibacillus baekrokdamisoli TaxID=1712516 RepID=A0A3G9IRM8_9BACL|nr:stage V sporulation protein AB [Paenibacillus baekrokdamisoli]MBB3069589.1 stage V sporulation protein AB [Paenibacillus baekrokdamisoli]BBH21056.1 stage V sporulation protein AB [Paenibacillus baekrokdamisoli]
MMISWAANAFVMLLGIAGGLAVGSGLVALLIVLDLIPRLAQLSYGFRKSLWYETAVVSGAVFWSLADFLDIRLWLPSHSSLIFVGLLDGIFIGMLAAALTEVMNVLPILAKRLRLSGYLVSLLMAMVLGKVTGSLFDWLVFQWK